ncbi:MAG: hypothetical protein K6G85_04745 [Eubacterium sp.]|nr:hypothetical protein [Eubacterium sp.]
MRDIYEFGEIPVEIKNRGNYFKEICADYIVDGKEPLFSIAATDEDLAFEQAKAEEDVKFGKSYLEYIALYRLFCERAVDYQVYLCHGSVLEMDGDAYMFTAASGTGKSTHARLWRETFGERVTMINDDKPLLRMKDDGIYAYGTPWDGKHHLSSNRHAKLKGICFLVQAKENRIRRVRAEESLPLIMNQIYRPRKVEALVKTMQFVDQLIEKIPMYILECNISEEAAKLSYETMSK